MNYYLLECVFPQKIPRKVVDGHVIGSLCSSNRTNDSTLVGYCCGCCGFSTTCVVQAVSSVVMVQVRDLDSLGTSLNPSPP